MKQATLLLLLIPFMAIAQDSLFLSTDKPTSTWEDNPATLGMEYTVAKRGTIKAVKFWKQTASVNPYTVTVWDTTGGVWFTQAMTTSKTGWQRLPCSLLAVPGMKYIVGVFNNDTHYGYKNGMYPKTKGALTATGGRFGYPASLPGNPGSCYYLDVVFQPDAQPPVTASVTPEKGEFPYRLDSLIIHGSIKNAVSYIWEVVDSFGTMRCSGLNTLNPVLRPLDAGGCWINLMLTARGIDGIETAAMAVITFLPDPEQVIGEIHRNGTIFWKRRVFIE